MSRRVRPCARGSAATTSPISVTMPVNMPGPSNGRLQDCGREFLPDGLHARKARNLQRMLVQRHPADAVEMVVVEKNAARLEQRIDRLIAGSDCREIVQIVNGNTGDGEIERPADGVGPGRIAQVAKRIAHLSTMALQAGAGMREH